MKTISFVRVMSTFVFVVSFAGFAGSAAHAQMGGYYGNGYPGMMGGYYPNAQQQTVATDTGQTIASSSTTMDATEALGQALAVKLQNKTVSCASLTQSDYQSLGEYYMSLMMGSGHDAMDQVIVSRYGEAYDDQMHIAMGERFSGCNVNVTFPAGMMGFGPMMGSFGNGYGNGGYGMMNGWGNYGMGSWGPFGFGYGWGGAVFMIVFWILAIIGLVALIKWIINYKKK